MKIKITLVRSSNQQSPRKPAPEPIARRSAPKAQLISTNFASYLKGPALEALRNQKPVRILPAKERQHPAAAGGLLGRALTWLNANRSAPGRLRVLETVPLGDKRLVAVIQADGRRFLVGGGQSGVTLLTALDQAQKPLSEFDSSPGLRELAG
jgi:hypothetical protein